MPHYRYNRHNRFKPISFEASAAIDSNVQPRFTRFAFALSLTGSIVLATQSVHAFSPMPAELSPFYPNQNTSFRSNGDVTAGLEFEESGHTMTVASSGNFIVLEIDRQTHATLRRASTNTAAILRATRRVSTAALSHFDDQFDFVIVSHNEADPEPNASYLGIHFRASNDVSGLARPLTSRAGTFGSAGKLQSVIHLPLSGGLRGGPSLHEMMHRWANGLNELKGDRRGHWGFTSVDGVLGGFDRSSLKRPATDDGVYTASGRGFGASAGFREDGYVYNTITFSPLEQYLMGARSGERVKDIEEMINPQRDSNSRESFTATGSRMITVSDIVARDGERLPPLGASQKQFRILYVVATDKPISDADWNFHNEQVALFSRPGDDGDDDLLNFWEATEGWGTVDFDGLSEIAHASVALPSDYTDIKVTSFSQRQGRTEVSSEDNFWVNAVISQTGPATLSVDGMRMGLRGLTDTASEFVRCESNWAPFDFPAGYVIETNRMNCSISTPGRYQAELQVRIDREWTAVFSGDSFTVHDLAPPDFDAINVEAVTGGTEPGATENYTGQRYWARARFSNAADRDLSISGLTTVLKSLDDPAADVTCVNDTSDLVLTAAQPYDTGRIFCPVIDAAGDYAIAVNVLINGGWNELGRTSTITVVAPPATKAADISVNLSFLSDVDEIVAEQVGNLRIRGRYTNTGPTDAVFDSVRIDVTSADGSLEAVCYDDNSTVTVVPGASLSTGNITCPTLNNVGTFDLTTRFRVNGDNGRARSSIPVVVNEPVTNVIDDIVVSDVVVTSGPIQISSTDNFSASLKINNTGRRPARLQSLRLRLLNVDETSSGGDVVCFETNLTQAIPVAGNYATGNRACALSAVGKFAFVVDVKVAEQWYEKYRSNAIQVTSSQSVCNRPQNIRVVNTNDLRAPLLLATLSQPREQSGRTDVTTTVAGRKSRVRRGGPSISDYWVGISAIRVSDPAAVKIDSSWARGNTVAEGVAKSMIVPVKGAAAWSISFCEPGWVEIDLDFMTRAVNLILAASIMDGLPGAGRINHDDIIQLSSELSAIASFELTSNYFRRALTDLRAGQTVLAKRRLNAAMRRFSDVITKAGGRRALFSAFRNSGIRLWRPVTGETAYKSFIRQLMPRYRNGSLAKSIINSFNELDELIQDARSGPGVDATQMRVRIVGQ